MFRVGGSSANCVICLHNTGTPYPGANEIYNFGRPFLGHYYQMHLICLNQSREEDFKRNNAFSQYD